MHFNEKRPGIHVLLYPYGDRPWTNLLIGNNSGRRSMMIMGECVGAEQKQGAHKATKKSCQDRGAHPREYKMPGHDVYAGRDCHAHVQTDFSVSCRPGNTW